MFPSASVWTLTCWPLGLSDCQDATKSPGSLNPSVLDVLITSPLAQEPPARPTLQTYGTFTVHTRACGKAPMSRAAWHERHNHSKWASAQSTKSDAANPLRSKAWRTSRDLTYYRERSRSSSTSGRR